MTMAKAKKFRKSTVYKLMQGFNKEYKAEAGKLIDEINRYLSKGKSVTQAVQLAMKKTSFNAELQRQITSTVYQAALEGYGLVPSIVTTTGEEAVTAALLNKSWTGDGVTFSKRLHGTDNVIRQKIISTVTASTLNNNMVIDMARKLYDGYNSGVAVLKPAELPSYLSLLTARARLGANGDKDMVAAVVAMARRLEETNVKGLQTKALKAAYTELLKAATDLKPKALERAVMVAVNEKSRYYAERIARTESSRAWYEAYRAKNDQDKDIAAYKWRLSTAHGADDYDICDLYAETDFGMGQGVFAKAEVPGIPVHPHCMCELTAVYKWELSDGAVFDWGKGKDFVSSLNERQQKSLMGKEGLEKFKAGGDWQKLTKNSLGGAEVNRLSESLLGIADGPVEQDYKVLDYGNNKEFTEIINAKPVELRKLENGKYETYISQAAHIKPKQLSFLENSLTKAFALLEDNKAYVKPKIRILAANEMQTTALASYSAEKNMLTLMEAACDKKRLLQLQVQSAAPKNSLSTFLHELLHWDDAEKYRLAHGGQLNQGEYIAELIEEHKKIVEKLEKKGYNLRRTSEYASYSYFKGRFDEVYTEFRVKKLLKEG